MPLPKRKSFVSLVRERASWIKVFLALGDATLAKLADVPSEVGVRDMQSESCDAVG